MSPDPRARLRGIVDAFPGQGFAVVDGGHFPDLPAEFRRERLFARSLFLDKSDPEVQAAGPWLVALGQAPDATDKVFALVGDKPAAVFWCCDAGEMVLWGHLRGLNMARIPAGAERDGVQLPSDRHEVEANENVMFRHWDPRVLGAIFPTLDAGQFARILGKAHEIAFSSEDFGGARRVVFDESWPATPTGFLRFQPYQISQINNRRIDASQNAICTYLRAVAPEDTCNKTDNELRSIVAKCQDSGERLGLTHERAHGQWAYLMISTNGRIVDRSSVTRYVQNGPGSPDENLYGLVKKMIRLSETDYEVR